MHISKKKKKQEQNFNKKKKKKRIGLKAVYGICDLQKSKYLMVVTESTILGSIYNKSIQKLGKVLFFPINP